MSEQITKLEGYKKDYMMCKELNTKLEILKHFRKSEYNNAIIWLDLYIESINRIFKQIDSLNENKKIFINQTIKEIKVNYNNLDLIFKKIKSALDKLEEIKYSDDVKEIKG